MAPLLERDRRGSYSALACRDMARPPVPLGGKVVAVTGGGRGIGRAIAAALVGRGMKVAIGDVDSEAAERTGAELQCAAYPLDVTDPASFEAFLDRIEA